MKLVEGSTVATNLVSSGNVLSISTSTRYNGMIQESSYKKARNSLFSLIDYVAQIAKPFFGVHAVVSFWRVLQFYGVSFCPRYGNIWTSNHVMSKVLDYLSVIWGLFPGSIHDSLGPILLLVYCVINIIADVIIFSSSYSFAKNAKLKDAVPPVISLYFGTIGYLFPPIAVTFLGEMIGNYIVDSKKYATALSLVSFILTFIVTLVFFWFFSTIYSVSIIFKPDSLTTSVPNLGKYQVLSTYSVSFFLALGSRLPKIPQIVILAVSLIVYACSIIICVYEGGFTSMLHARIFSTSCVSGAVNLAIIIVFTIINKPCSEITFFIMIVIWIVLYFILSSILTARVSKCLRILDSIEANEENFSLIKRAPKCCDLIVRGFEYAHPICLDGSIFKNAIRVWPKNVTIWLLYAKFTAIFPEQTQQLSFISMGMMQNHLSGALAKHTLSQIHSISGMRELNLIPQLKSKLDKIGKHIQATKHKIRYIWDLIIQGNVKELETVVERAYNSIDQDNAEFLHILRQFPNSRFVARSYARFLRDVVADHAGHKIWASNASLLQRGISVVPDQAHDLGLRAFPLLPKSIVTDNPSAQSAVGMITDESLTQEIEGDDEQAAIDAELRVAVRNSIQKLNIPSFHHTKICRFVTLILIFLIPVIAMTVYIPIYTKDLVTPLNFLYILSDLRYRYFQFVGCVHHFAAEKIQAIKFYPPLDKTETGEEPPAGMGSSYKTYDHLMYVIEELRVDLMNIDEINSFKKNEKSLDQARSSIFNDEVDLSFIANGQIFSQKSSVKTGITEGIVCALTMLEEYNENLAAGNDELTDLYMQTRAVMIPILNTEPITNALSKSLELICKFLSENEHTINTLMITLMVIFIVISFVVYVILFVWSKKTIVEDKMRIYKCLTSLPKNIVSRVADTFKVMKKEDDDDVSSTQKSRDEDVNKQEENMLKIFGTFTDNSTMHASDNIILGIITIFVFILHIAVIIVICLSIKNSTWNLALAAPHIDYTTASYSYDIASLVLLNMMATALIGPNYQVAHFSPLILQDFLLVWQTRAKNTYITVRYGDKNLGIQSLATLDQSLVYSDQIIECSLDKMQATPIIMHDIYGCWSGDLLYAFSQMNVGKFIALYKHNGNVFKADAATDKLTHLWHVHLEHIFSQFFHPVFTTLVSKLQGMLESEVPNTLAISWVLFIVGTLMEIFLFVSLTKSEERQRYALRLLLHCPGNVVVSNPHITALLAGNFKKSQVDTTTRDAEFYDEVLKHMPDAVFILDNQCNIVNINNATLRIFDKTQEELETHPISILKDQIIEPQKEGLKDLNLNLNGSNNGSTMNNVVENDVVFDFDPFKDLINRNEKGVFHPYEKAFGYKKRDGNVCQIVMTFNQLQDNIILTAHDITQQVLYNRLISDERAKSDQLLSSILPAKLVQRVAVGEKNISFAVQTVTIVFMDIVSFTPWCGQLPAATVMSTLNKIYKEFDLLTALHTTMTKIKCIGDCYMAAGGIFADVNQPAVHAKDVVEFALESIQAIIKLDEELNENLRIRCGINTGGPIVAGVLGTEKPTFEILGPAINMAQQMEHNGLPMKVHISRAVYEMIYGGGFNVKERGEIKLKNGPAVTYIVDPKS